MSSTYIAACLIVAGLSFWARVGWSLAGRLLDYIRLGDKVAEIHNHYANCQVTVASEAVKP